MSNNNEILERILINLTHDTNLLYALNRFNLRLFYSRDLYLAWNENDIQKVHTSIAKCTLRIVKTNKLDMMYVTNDKFSLYVKFKKIDKTHYTYSEMFYLDKLNHVRYDINEVKKLGTNTPQKLILKR